MGNNRLAANCHLPGHATNEPAAPGANGILGRIQAQYVSAAILALPAVTSAPEEHVQIDMDAGPDGRVRFFAEKKHAKHHRHSYCYWSVYRAEPLRTDDLL